MVTLVAVGVLLIASGPSLALWGVILQRHAHLLVISILASFMWVMAMVTAGAIWHMIPPLRDEFAWVIFVIVSAQEIARFSLYVIFQYMSRRAEGTEAFIRPGDKNNVLTGLAVGTGYAVMTVFVQFYALIADEFLSDTAIYIEKCSINFFVAASAFTLGFSLLQIALGVWTWPAYSAEKKIGKLMFAYLVHLGFAQMTLFNRRTEGCKWNLGVNVGLAIFTLLALCYYNKSLLVKQ